ncbi:MAG: glycoside hydrolase family 43 protein [Muribaculaceae bacterium]|nr:glycoside hydrolase family 43 protein [Muribaculaceae bacterium]
MFKPIIISVLLGTLCGIPAFAADEIPYADPTIFLENGTYYLTGSSAEDGFKMLQSDDLKHWRPVDNGNDGYILRRGDRVFGTYCFWAPQIYKEGGKYYLTYSAEGKICVAESDIVTGPYIQREVRPVGDWDEMNIDTYLFRDNDGKHYMYHARYKQQGDLGGNTIYVMGYDLDSNREEAGTLRLCAEVSEPWELTENGRKFGNKTLEGPTVIKLDGKYYLFYSANDYQSTDYAVGYAVADSPYGPWTKNEGNPIIHRSLVGENGAGHGDFFNGKDGRAYYVYHVHASDTDVHPRKVRIVPLKIEKDKSNGIYSISADTSGIIYPVVSK